jgi:gliding motility-associated-like protein
MNAKVFFPFFLFLLFFQEGQSQQPISPDRHTPPGFLPNHGQVRDLQHNPVNYVYYQANLAGQQVFLTKYGLSIVLTRIRSTHTEALLLPDNQKKHDHTDSTSVAHIEMERIDINLKNASILPQNITGTQNPSSPVFNFYIDDSTSSSTLIQEELLVKNVYPGIDWRLYIQHPAGATPHLKYDFIVHPGADISRIQLQYSPNAQLSLQEGSISAQTHMGTIREEKPYTFVQETEQEVPAQFQLRKNTLRFQTAAYDQTQTLVIDPSIFWMTYLTSSGSVFHLQSTSGNDIETDDNGNIFTQLSAATYARFPTLNPGNGAYYQDMLSSPKGAMLLIKFSPGGKMLWSTYFGNGVRGSVMTRSKTGELYAIGTTYDGTPSDPNPNPSIPLLNNNGYYDGAKKKYFITRFSNDGKLLWSSYYVNFDSYPIDMTWDVNGNIYTTGWSTRYDFPRIDPGGGAYMNNPSSGLGYAQTIFVSQFNDKNQLIWSTRIEGNDYDPNARICTDKKGNIYIGGQNRSNNLPIKDAGGYYNTNAFGSFIIRFNPSREITFCTYVPGAFLLSDITTDNNSNLYVTIGNRILKFDADTKLEFQVTVPTTKMHFWKRIVYDERNDELQLLGVMNDGYWDFPTLNTACNGSFFHNGQSPRKYNNATGPVFATIGTDGNFSYRSLTDWVYEYYDNSDMTLDPEGNMIYLFFDNRNAYNNPNPQLTDPGNGAYFDKNCCYQSASLSSLLLKLNRSELSATVTTTPATGCDCNGLATVTPQCGQAPFSYLWSTGATTASVTDLCPGKYWVRISDANNLTKIISIDIPLPPDAISAITKSVVDENCDRSNGSIYINNITGGYPPYQYSINGASFQSTAQFPGLKKGRYIIRIKDSKGCFFSDTTDLGRIDGPQSLQVNITAASCIADDGQFSITTVTGGVTPYTFKLNGGNASTNALFTGLSASTYQFQVIDAAGCTLTQSVTIPKATPPVDASTTLFPEHCDQKNGRIEINQVTGGKSPYTWSIDNNTFTNASINNLSKGSYSLFVKDANGCILTKTNLQITEVGGPTSATEKIDHAYCGKLTGSASITAVMNGTSPYQYALDNSSFGTTNTFTNIIPGSHQIRIRDANGCILSKDVTIDSRKQATFSVLPKDTILCYGETLDLRIEGEISRLKNINWNIPAQSTSAKLFISENQKSIVVTALDDNDCLIIAQTNVLAKACNPPEKCLAIPTAFTPNGDGLNDIAIPIVNGCNIKSIRFQIFNRFGELIFQTDKLGVGWNGMIKSEEQNTGVFITYCEYTTEDNVTVRLKNTLLLIH